MHQTQGLETETEASPSDRRISMDLVARGTTDPLPILSLAPFLISSKEEELPFLQRIYFASPEGHGEQDAFS